MLSIVAVVIVAVTPKPTTLALAGTDEQDCASEAGCTRGFQHRYGIRTSYRYPNADGNCDNGKTLSAECCNAMHPLAVAKIHTVEYYGRAPNITFLHVGKTGGSTVQKYLQHNRVSMHMYHQVPYSRAECEAAGPSMSFVVATRDPVARIVSNFNWRHPRADLSLVAGHRDRDEHTNCFELSMYSCFEDANDMAEALDSNTPCGQVARDALNVPVCHIHSAINHSFYIANAFPCLASKRA